VSDVAVFLGPSLSLAEAERIARFSYRPPAAQGDILQAVRDGARFIGLVDGYFEGAPAVWHKEILFALDAGVHVFGAASMGALRAAELDTFGMRGIGRIYEWYANGFLDADDEVALIHTPAEMGFAPLSEPLVNVRATLEAAVAAAVVTTGIADRLLTAARRIFYKQRTWDRILADVELGAPEVGALAEWLPSNQVDQKQLDARAMLKAISEFLAGRPGRFRADFTFEPTDAWNLGLDAFNAALEISQLDRLVVDEARLDPSRFQTLLDAAALNLPTAREARGSVGSRAASRLVDRFRRERELMDRNRFNEWLEANAISEPELKSALSLREDVASRIDRSMDRLIPAIVTEIKLRGLYGPLAERAKKKAEALAGPEGRAAAKEALPTSRLLLEWFFEQRLSAPVPDDLDSLCRDLALPGRTALQELLAREFLFDSLNR
jgi:hypothetical protein